MRRYFGTAAHGWLPVTTEDGTIIISMGGQKYFLLFEATRYILFAIYI